MIKPSDPNEEYIKEAIRNLGLPKPPDWDAVNETLQAEAKIRASIQHAWRQRGPELICTSCPYEHSQWVGMDKRLNGFDSQGRPILDTVM